MKGVKKVKTSKKAKWIIGAAGVSFSAFVLSQMGGTESIKDPIQPEIVMDDTMSQREKELLALDWTNLNRTPIQKNDRTTRRS